MDGKEFYKQRSKAYYQKNKAKINEKRRNERMKNNEQKS